MTTGKSYAGAATLQGMFASPARILGAFGIRPDRAKLVSTEFFVENPTLVSPGRTSCFARTFDQRFLIRRLPDFARRLLWPGINGRVCPLTDWARTRARRARAWRADAMNRNLAAANCGMRGVGRPEPAKAA